MKNYKHLVKVAVALSNALTVLHFIIHTLNDCIEKLSKQ